MSPKIIRTLNDIITFFACSRLNITHVVEYPKCGGTWVSRMIRSYLNIDRKYGNDTLIRTHSVIQKHQLYHRSYHKPVIVIRDPRDVWVSYYFHEVYHSPKGSKKFVQFKFDPQLDDKQNLVNYIQEKMTFPNASVPGFTYEEFIDSWLCWPHIHVVRYEDLIKNTAIQLTEIIKFLNLYIFQSHIQAVVTQNSFKSITGRESGTEEKASHKRKGIIGDWKNYFTDASCQLVQKHQGKLLRRLGYETEENWIEQFLSSSK